MSLNGQPRFIGMPRSATDTLHDIINAAVVDAIVALKDAARGLPNALLRDVNAIHANTAFEDLPDAVRSTVTSSVRGAFSKLQKEGYVIAEANSVGAAAARREPRASESQKAGGQPRPSPRSTPRGRPRPTR